MVTEFHAAAAEVGPPGSGGAIADRYESLFVIGEGGMGRVEVAIERGSAGAERVVALKRLLPKGLRDARHAQMFLREARLAALLAHPNVVHAYSFGETDGELFLAMEYVEGEPLSRVLSAGRTHDRGLDPVLVASILADVCDGLHAAHELCDESGHPLRVVHRDVSPHNVMVAYDGNVKVVDFGVAKFERSGQATRTGEVKGKMEYMSPEQAFGEDLDRRTDLFSVGAMLFECLTGRRMWGNGTDIEVMRRIALETPPRLDTALPGAPRSLVELHARLVARDRNDRPPTARDVAAALRAFTVAAGQRDSREAVRQMMATLFAGEAERRRERLLEAVSRVSPANAVGLGGLVPATSVRPPAGPLLTKRWLLPVVTAVIALAFGAAMLTLRGTERSVAPPSPVERLSPIDNRVSAPAVVASELAPDVTTVVAPANPSPVSTATIRKASPVPNRPAKRPKLPDVDPSPF